MSSVYDRKVAIHFKTNITMIKEDKTLAVLAINNVNIDTINTHLFVMEYRCGNGGCQTKCKSQSQVEIYLGGR